MSYDPHFYDVIRDGAQRSVRAAMPIIGEALRLKGRERVLDVGCGEGWWADGFAGIGCTVFGIDTGVTPHRPDTFTFVERDLAAPFEFDTGSGPPFNLVVSLEVAEHLPPSRAAGFIQDLCKHADTILFSAAIPGQGGTGHLNEQWPDYWADRFEANGFSVSGALRWRMWGNPEIENWYQQNMLVAMRHPYLDELGAFTEHPLFAEPLLTRPHRVVNPVLWDARRPRR